MKEEKGTYILGMAKSPLKVIRGDFNGIADDFAKPINPGSAKSMELDFLRLVYAKKQLMLEGFKVHVFMVVTTPQVVEYVQVWTEKYGVERMVQVRAANLTRDEVQILVNEKTRNGAANRAEAENREINARADNGRRILEEELERIIQDELGVMIDDEFITTNQMPFAIRWDYCVLRKKKDLN